MNTKTQIVLVMGILFFALTATTVSAVNFCSPEGATMTCNGCANDIAYKETWTCVDMSHHVGVELIWMVTDYTTTYCGSDTVGERRYYVDATHFDGKVYQERTVINRDCENDKCYERTSVEKKNFRDINDNTVKTPFYDERPLIHIGNRQKPETRHL